MYVKTVYTETSGSIDVVYSERLCEKRKTRYIIHFESKGRKKKNSAAGGLVILYIPRQRKAIPMSASVASP